MLHSVSLTNVLTADVMRVNKFYISKAASGDNLKLCGTT